MYGVRADVAAVSPGSSAAGKGQLRVISACASDALRRPQASGTTTTPSFSHASAPRMMGYLAPQPQRPSGITPHVTHLWHREDTKCAQTSSVPVTVSQHHSILRVVEHVLTVRRTAAHTLQEPGPLHGRPPMHTTTQSAIQQHHRMPEITTPIQDRARQASGTTVLRRSACGRCKEGRTGSAPPAARPGPSAAARTCRCSRLASAGLASTGAAATAVMAAPVHASRCRSAAPSESPGAACTTAVGWRWRCRQVYAVAPCVVAGHCCVLVDVCSCSAIQWPGIL